MIVRLLGLALIASELCAFALAAEPKASPGEWKFISDKDGVTIYRRQRTLSYESKAIGDIAASTDEVQAIVTAERLKRVRQLGLAEFVNRLRGG